MYFTVSVKVVTDDGQGKIKKSTERYLVEAMTVTEAEARVSAHMDKNLSYEISSASQSRILEVICPACTPSAYGK